MGDAAIGKYPLNTRNVFLLLLQKVVLYGGILLPPQVVSKLAKWFRKKNSVSFLCFIVCKIVLQGSYCGILGANTCVKYVKMVLYQNIESSGPCDVRQK